MIVLSSDLFSNELATVDNAIDEQLLDSIHDYQWQATLYK